MDTPIDPNRRPRILITGVEADGGARWDDYAAAFASAVERAGGEAVPFYSARDAVADGVPAHDGLVVIGGIDVDPAVYGEAPHPRLGRTERARDEAEAALIRDALEADRPLLAICRGAQVMNVACGGSLLQHIEPREPHRGPRGTDESGWHGVEVAAGSLLARVAGAPTLLVNSRHHQAVTPDRLAPGLVATARTDDGGLEVIEAIEAPDRTFALGVQWHPERLEMLDDAALDGGSARLFAAFVAACRAAQAARAAQPA